MSEPFLLLILNGAKTIESRFSVNRVAPYQRACTDDIVLLKQQSEPVVGWFEIAWASYHILNPTTLATIKEMHSHEIGADEAFWQAQSRKRYATLIGVRHLQECKPLTITKRDQRSWITLRDRRLSQQST